MAAGAAAWSSLSISLALLLLLSGLSLTLSFASTPETAGQAEQFGGLGRRVGGKEEIKDVLDNPEVQDLGRFSVEDYNRVLRQKKADLRLSFSRVVSGQRQVVSGIQYYLKVVVRTRGAGRTSAAGEKTYDAVVLVKPWLKSKEVVSFAPTSPN